MNEYTIIVAEDEALIRNSLVRNINNCHMGFEVIGTAQDGQEVLDQLERKVPHVLMTDIHMPVINGLELNKIVEQNYPDIFKVIISGYDNFDYARQAFEVNVQHYLLKPVLHEDMMEVLSKLRIKLDKQLDSIMDKLELSKDHDYSIDEALVMIQEYMKKNYTTEVNLDMLASSFYFNSTYLSRNFTKKYGQSPSKYLCNLRINKAKQLLVNNHELNVREIGELVGYENQAYFCRIFKSRVGQTPSQYRDDVL